MRLRLRLILLAAIALALSPTLAAQALDDYGGLISAACPAPRHQVTATCSWNSGVTTQTCTVPTGDGANYATKEPIALSGSSTALDTVYDGTTVPHGASETTSVVGDTLTMTAPAANPGATLTNITVTLRPDKFYVPADLSGNLIPVATSWGSRRAFCTPEGHWFFEITLSNTCASLTSANCNFGPITSTSVSRTAGVVTLTIASPNHVSSIGMPIQVTNCADTTFNVGSPGTPVQTLNNSTGLTFTYNAAGADGTTTGCKIQGFGWNPLKFATYGVAQTDARCRTAAGELARYIAMGFNNTGEDSDPYIISTGGCNASPKFYPFFAGGSTPSASRSPGMNLDGCAAQAMKIPMATIPPSVSILGVNFPSHGTGGNVMFDWMAPQFSGWLTCRWNVTNGTQPFASGQSPDLIGLPFDDTDNMQQTAASGVMHTVPVGSGHSRPDPGLLTLYSAPQITLSDGAVQTSGVWTTPLLFPTTCDFSKSLATSCGLTAPTSCTDDTPCSLVDFLRIRYGTIAALNTAWGSSYTQFASTAVAHAAECISGPACSGNNPTSYTFAHTNITPRSIEICVTLSGAVPVPTCGSGVMVTGDCSLGSHDCPTGTVGTATFLAPPGCFNGGSAIQYSTTGILCTDPNGNIEQVSSAGQTGTAVLTWPASCSGSQTTTSNVVVWTCLTGKVTGTLSSYSTGASSFAVGGAGLPLGATLSTTYSTGGWDAGGTGLEDEDGTGRMGVTVTNGINLVCPQTYATGIVAAAYQTEVSFVNGGKNWWAMALTSGTTADPAPAFTTTQAALVTGSDGIHWEMLGNPVTDAPGGSNGDSGWGTPTPHCPAYTTQSANFAKDLSDWDEQYMSAYFGTVHKVLSANYPDTILFGANFGLGSYNAPTWIGGLKAADKYTDAAFVGAQLALGSLAANGPLSPLSLAYETNYFHHPIVSEPFMGSCGNDWQGGNKTCSASSSVVYGNLTLRAQGWYAMILGSLTFTAPDGTRPFNGVAWWTDHINDNGSAVNPGSFALLDYSDNRLDGHEDVTATVSCSPPLAALTCGGESPNVPWLGVNEESITQGILAGNALWLTGTVPPQPPAPPRLVITVSGDVR